jgi:hypothetical protein
MARRLICAITLLLTFTGAVGSVNAQTRHAVLIGVSDYPRIEGMDLNGPKNDVALMRTLLITNLGYKASDIVVLADHVDGAKLPTKGQIFTELAALTERVRATPGADEVFLYFAGHGSRQPAKPEDIPHRSLDGFDAIFLPRDVGQWTSEQRSVENAVLNSELRQIVEDMQKAGAFVWIVIDSCHAGYSLRSGGVRPRFISADKLGIPKAEIAASAAFAETRSSGMRTRGARQERLWMSFSQEATSAGGWVAFFASRPDEQALEIDFPVEAPDGSPGTYGLFTLQLFRAVQSNPTASFKQIAQEILRTQGTFSLNFGEYLLKT